MQSPFQGDGEGLEALDGDAARRAKVLREALRSMNKGVPPTDAQMQQTIAVCTQTRTKEIEETQQSVRKRH